MSIFFQQSISNEFIKMRWAEPYVTNGLNIKDFGVVRPGIYSGFIIGPNGLGLRGIGIGPGYVSGIPSVGSGSVSGYVSGAFDATVDYSIAVQQYDGYSLTIQIPPGMSSVQNIDATGVPAGRKFIIIKASYQITQQTTAQFMLVDGTYIDQNPSVIVIGYVDIPSNPLTPLDATMFGYLDLSYPRLTPLATPQKAGLMPPSFFDSVSGWAYNDLMLMSVSDINPFMVSITPSQKVILGKRIYTYVKGFNASKFPRNAAQKYNGGPNNDQLTLLNIATGGISGAHQLPGNLSFSTPSIQGTPNKFQIGLVSVDELDNIFVNYSSALNTYAETQDEDNMPTIPSNLFQVGAFIAETDGSGVLNPLNPNTSILWRRPFLNTGSIDSGIGNVEFYQEELSGVVNGINTIFTTSKPIKDSKSTLVVLDSLVSEGEYSASGSTITFLNPPAKGQVPYVFYVADSPNPLRGFQEVPSGIVNSVSGADGNGEFVLSGNPANNQGTMVFVDGVIVETNKWYLVQGGPASKIQFVSGFYPIVGQDVYVFYFINQLTVGTPPATGGLLAQGSGASPISVHPAVGIYPTGDIRQLKYIVSPGGAQTVTAIPQIQPGSIVGQELWLKGESDTDYLIFNDGNGLSLNGSIQMKLNAALCLVWSGVVWEEFSRR